MSIAPVGSGISSAIYSSAQPIRAKAEASPASVPSTSGVAPASDTVTLSTEAQALASLNAMGVTVANVARSGLSSGGQLLSASAAVYGSESNSDFEAVAARFGATAQQANQDFAVMDSNGNGLISNAELLSAMSKTSQNNDALSQSLRQLMDTNRDGSVSSSEFVALETAVVSEEK